MTRDTSVTARDKRKTLNAMRPKENKAKYLIPYDKNRPVLLADNPP